jgi:hypothetical protein
VCSVFGVTRFVVDCETLLRIAAGEIEVAAKGDVIRERSALRNVTSEAPRAFSSGWPSKSADAQTRSGVIREHWPRRADEV